MKKTTLIPDIVFLVISISFFLFPNNSFSQEGIWADPVAVTDSVTNNKNPNIITFYDDAYMFWEKSTAESSTAIYMRNLSDMGEPIVILEDEGIHYRNPQFIQFDNYPNPPDTLFYLFYESDIEGGFNIYYMKYSQDGNFTEPFDIGVSYTDSEHLRITDRNIIWEAGGLIILTHLQSSNGTYSFTEPINIDAGDCMNPEIGHNNIIYEKIVDGQSQIYRSTYDYQNDVWSTPEEFYAEGDNTSLSIVSETEMMFEDMTFIWESYQNEEWEIFGYEIWEEEFESLNIESTSNLTPSAIYYDVVLCEACEYIYLSYLTYAYNENGNDDIFVTESHGRGQYVNISNSSAEDSKPKLFHSPTHYTYRNYLLWESNRNNHQQIFMSKVWFIVNTKEEDKNNFNVEISPNPFHENLQINFLLNESAYIELCILNENGQQLATLLNGLQKTGNHSINWKPIIENGKWLSTGMYFIRLKIDNEMITQKIILQ